MPKVASPAGTRPNFTPRAPGASASSGSPQIDGLGNALLAQGKTETKQLAKAWAQAIVAQLKKEGLFGATLKSTVVKIQQDAGLPATGRLDGKTLDTLEGKAPSPSSAQLAGKDGAAKTNVLGARPRAEAGTQQLGGKQNVGKGVQKPNVQQGPVTPRSPQRLGGKTTPTRLETTQNVGGPRAGVAPETVKGAKRGNIAELLQNLMRLGFLGALRGGDATSDAIQTFQKQVGLPPSGLPSPATQEAAKVAVKNVVVDENHVANEKAPAGSGANSGAGKEAKADAKTTASQSRADASASNSLAQGSMKTDASAAERARLQNDDGAPATMRGVQSQADLAALAGRAALGEGQALKSGSGGDGSGQIGDAQGGAASDDEDGTENLETNAHAGDEDESDEDRGWANMKAEGDGEGYWQTKTLSTQIVTALDDITRDDDGTGPATYRWDVTFYRPGVYGAGQPATPLWHIGIEQVTAFDAVWDNARRVLTKRLAQLEPDERPLTAEDFEMALRRARVRRPQEDDAPSE